MPQKPEKPAEPSWLKPATDYGPLALFLLGYWRGDLFLATKLLIVASILMAALNWFLVRRLPVVLLVTTLVVAVFGGLTLWLQDERFIKMKPTIIQLCFALLLWGGILLGRHPLKALMGAHYQLPDHAWKKLSIRFGGFFIAMAGLNELVWRTQSTDIWVNFKIFGIIGLTLAFSLAQAPFLLRHQQQPPANDTNE